jgi:hypothetical protein
VHFNAAAALTRDRHAAYLLDTISRLAAPSPVRGAGQLFQHKLSALDRLSLSYCLYQNTINNRLI